MALYEVEMMFTASVGLKRINGILRECGCDEVLQVKDAFTFTVKQVLVEMPDEEYLKKVADIIKENYETKDINIISCHFSGYRNVRVIKREELVDAE